MGILARPLTLQQNRHDSNRLQKLMWGKGKQSEKQWRDVLGVLKLQGDYFDYAYLTDWAERLDIVESISQAFSEAGI